MRTRFPVVCLQQEVCKLIDQLQASINHRVAKNDITQTADIRKCLKEQLGLRLHWVSLMTIVAADFSKLLNQSTTNSHGIRRTNLW
jgi:hypothetical protein